MQVNIIRFKVVMTERFFWKNKAKLKKKKFEFKILNENNSIADEGLMKRQNDTFPLQN